MIKLILAHRRFLTYFCKVNILKTSMNWPVFFKRLGSAVFFCAIILAALLTNFEVFLAITLLVQFLCIKEYWAIVKAIYPDDYFPNWLYWCTQVTGVAVSLAIAMLTSLSGALYLLFLIPVILIFAAVIQNKTAMTAVFSSFAGLLYISLPMGFFIALYMLQGTLQNNIPLALILLIWTNDTMAYISGSFIGKTPFSKISPKKTWEGTIGGVVFTVISIVIIHQLNWLPGLSLIDWIALALCASIAGTAGDLFESKLKRLANVKDSGNIMPGHGGALDRFDSLLFALPFTFCYVFLFMMP